MEWVTACWKRACEWFLVHSMAAPTHPCQLNVEVPVVYLGIRKRLVVSWLDYLFIYLLFLMPSESSCAENFLISTHAMFHWLSLAVQTWRECFSLLDYLLGIIWRGGGDAVPGDSWLFFITGMDSLWPTSCWTRTFINLEHTKPWKQCVNK